MKKNILKFVPMFSLIALFPSIVFAQNAACETLNTVNGINRLLCQIQSILNTVLPVLIALGVVYFVWGVVQYVIADGEEAKTKGRNSIIFGLIGLAVIISLWGLVYMITNTFDSGGLAPDNTYLNGLLPQPATTTTTTTTR